MTHPTSVEKMGVCMERLKSYVGAATWLGISGLSAYRVWQQKISIEKAVSIVVLVHQVLKRIKWLPTKLHFQEVFKSLGELGAQQKNINTIFSVARALRELFNS